MEMPGDRLALAVFVCCEQELVGIRELLAQIRHDALLVGIDDVVRLEVVVDRDAEGAVARALLLRNLGGAVRKVADMADARLDDVTVAEVGGDRFRLCRRLHDDETGAHLTDDTVTALSIARGLEPHSGGVGDREVSCSS